MSASVVMDSISSLICFRLSGEMICRVVTSKEKIVSCFLITSNPVDESVSIDQRRCSDGFCAEISTHLRRIRFTRCASSRLTQKTLTSGCDRSSKTGRTSGIWICLGDCPRDVLLRSIGDLVMGL